LGLAEGEGADGEGDAAGRLGEIDGAGDAAPDGAGVAVDPHAARNAATPPSAAP